MNNNSSRRLNIFLCHASEDKPIVRTIYKKLQKYNVELWFDEQNLLPGERWESIVPLAIQKCDIVIICLSRAFLLKEGYAHYEVHVVLEAAKRKPRDTIFHIPFRLDECVIPAYLQEWHYVSNFIAGDFEKIISACEKRRDWLNTYHKANIQPLVYALPEQLSVALELPQENVSGQGLPGKGTNEANQQASSSSSIFQGTSPRKSKDTPSSQQKQLLIQKYDMHASWVLAVAWEPEGTRIASAGADGTVRIWKAETGESLLTYRGHTRLLNKINLLAKIYTAAWSPDGQRIASSGDGANVYIWSAATGQTHTLYQNHSGLWPSVYTVAWSPDGQRIASACSSMGRDKTIHVWDTNTGQTLRHYDAHYKRLPDFSILSLAWSSDGGHLAAVCGDRAIRIWSTATGELVSMYHFRSNWSNHIAWSPNNQYLASAHSDHTVQIWDILTQANVRSYHEHTDSVRYVAWSPDGSCLATAANDKTVCLWEALTGTHLCTYRGHSDWVTSVSWSGDGTRIASASNDKTVHVWHADNR